MFQQSGYQAGSDTLFVVIVKTDQRRLYLMMIEQYFTGPGIFGSNQVHRFERLQSSKRNISEIPYRRADQKKRSGCDVTRLHIGFAKVKILTSLRSRPIWTIAQNDLNYKT